MNSRERLLAEIYHQEPDRVPVTPRIGARFVPWLRPSDGPEWKRHLEVYTRFGFDVYIEGIKPPGVQGIPILPTLWPSECVPPGLANISVKVDIRELDNDYDLVTRTIETPEGVLRDRIKVPKPAKLTEMRKSWDSTCPAAWFPDIVPFTIERLVKTIDDVERVKYLLPDPDRVDESDIDETRKYLMDKGLIAYYTNPIDEAVYAIGLKESIIAYYRNREMLERLLQVLQEHTLAATESLVEKGAEIIFHTNYMGGISAGWSPRIWNSLFKPLIKEHRDLVKKMGGLFQYYDDGNVMQILDGIREVQPDILTTAPWRFGNDLAIIKAEIGDRVCLKAGIDPDTVRFQTKEDVIDETMRSIKAAARGGGFILSSSDSLHAHTPFENMAALVDTAKTHGRYPLNL